MNSIHQMPGWLIGLLAGLSVGIGGAIKDAPYEGFKPLTFFRSPIVGLIVGWSIERQLEITNPVALFLATIGGERCVVEGYKLLRAQRPGKFDYGEWGIPKEQLASGLDQGDFQLSPLAQTQRREMLL